MFNLVQVVALFCKENEEAVVIISVIFCMFAWNDFRNSIHEILLDHNFMEFDCFFRYGSADVR